MCLGKRKYVFFNLYFVVTELICQHEQNIGKESINQKPFFSLVDEVVDEVVVDEADATMMSCFVFVICVWKS